MLEAVVRRGEKRENDDESDRSSERAGLKQEIAAMTMSRWLRLSEQW